MSDPRDAREQPGTGPDMREEDVDARLDQAIDALNSEHAPVLFADDDQDLIGLVDAARVARRLREPALPDDGYPEQLAAALRIELLGDAATIRQIPIDDHRAPVVELDHPVTFPRRRKRGMPVLLAAALRAVGVAVIAGMLAGALVGGIGGRAVMRVSGMLYEREHPGQVAITESSGRVVGSFSWGGTVDLMIEAMANGVIGGLLWLVFQTWLPRTSRPLRAGLLYGAVLLIALGSVVIDPDNTDFRRLGSPLVNVLMFAALFPLYGVVIAPTVAWLDRRHARPVTALFIGMGALGVLPMLVFGVSLTLVGLIIVIEGFGATGNVSSGGVVEGLLLIGAAFAFPVVSLLRVQAVRRYLTARGGRLGRLATLASHRAATWIALVVLAILAINLVRSAVTIIFG